MLQVNYNVLKYRPLRHLNNSTSTTGSAIKEIMLMRVTFHPRTKVQLSADKLKSGVKRVMTMREAGCLPATPALDQYQLLYTGVSL